MNGYSFSKKFKAQSIAVALALSYSVTTAAFSSTNFDESSIIHEELIQENALKDLQDEAIKGVPNIKEYITPDEIGQLENKAINGELEAQIRLGTMYENGEGVEQNYPKAIEHYELAAEQGDIASMVRLSSIYSDDMRGKKDTELANKYYTKTFIEFDSKIENLTQGNQDEAAFIEAMSILGLIKDGIETIKPMVNYMTPRYYVMEGEGYFKPKVFKRDLEKAFKNYTLAIKHRASEKRVPLNYDDPINMLVANNKFKTMDIGEATKYREQVKSWFHKACMDYKDDVSCSLLKIMDMSDRYIETKNFKHIEDSSNLELRNDFARGFESVKESPYIIELTVQPKVETVKSLYSEVSPRLVNNGNAGSYDSRALYSHADSNLKNAIFIAQNPSDSSDINKCQQAEQGLYLLDGDDFKFVTLNHGHIRVVAENKKKWGLKDYSLQCNDNSCVITDVFDKYGASAVENILKVCR